MLHARLKTSKVDPHHSTNKSWWHGNASGQNCSRPAMLQARIAPGQKLQARKVSGQNCSRPNASGQKMLQTKTASGQKRSRSKSSRSKSFRPKLLQIQNAPGQNCFRSRALHVSLLESAQALFHADVPQLDCLVHRGRQHKL